MINSPRRIPKSDQRTEEFTVNVGVFHGTTVTLTYSIEATFWTGTQGGGGGFVSARAREIRLTDQKGERVEYLYAPQAPGPTR